MAVDPQDDLTPEVAEAFDDVREEIAPGERYFLLKAAPWDGQGVEPIALGDDPNGEVLKGIYLEQIFGTPNYTARIAQMGDVSEAALAEMWGIGILRAGEAVANVYERVAVLVVPKVPTLREWKYGLTFTQQTFTPASPAFVPGVPVGVMPLTITRWEGYAG